MVPILLCMALNTQKQFVLFNYIFPRYNGFGFVCTMCRSTKQLTVKYTIHCVYCSAKAKFSGRALQIDLEDNKINLKIQVMWSVLTNLCNRPPRSKMSYLFKIQYI